eukprot:757407-Hanusia_phi.AAC.3
MAAMKPPVHSGVVGVLPEIRGGLKEGGHLPVNTGVGGRWTRRNAGMAERCGSDDGMLQPGGEGRSDGQNNPRPRSSLRWPPGQWKDETSRYERGSVRGEGYSWAAQRLAVLCNGDEPYKAPTMTLGSVGITISAASPDRPLVVSSVEAAGSWWLLGHRQSDGGGSHRTGGEGRDACARQASSD